MNTLEIINKLNQNQSVFKSLLESKTESEYSWRPSPEKWNLKEIVCHLLDEEILDFGFRTNHTLDTPLETLPPIDPEGWVISHDYASKDYHKTLSEFLEARSKSVSWLKHQTHSNWNNVCKHPTLGDISAKAFLNNWLAHDYLHLRQIIRYEYQYLQTKTDTSLNYAGNW
ncbi:DinB family protein [Seonamhaeicola sp. ML3]|uniref:DinB family protein n=1 Tax=Seonamhaeicola sp. ML3 TaxID=2937786 RepID=UPI0020109E90|nr:DinB family protein [Seonamhaeicola sp. ML3]